MAKPGSLIHLATWKKIKNNLITLESLKKQLEIRYETAHKLITEGIIKPAEGPFNKEYRVWMINKMEVDRFVEKYLRKLKTISNINDSWIPLKSAVLKLANYDIGTIGLLKLIKKGAILGSILNGRYTFKGLYFYKPDIERFIDESNRNRQIEIGYTPKEIAKLCKVERLRIEKMINVGKLVISHQKEYPNGKFSRYIDQQQVQDLLEEIRKYGRKEFFH